MGVKIPGLRQKFKLLVTYGPYDSIDKVAEKLGKRPKTIMSWADGTPSVDPDNVPNRSFQALARVFADAIGVDAGDPKISDLLLAPPSWLETELRQFSGHSFRSLLETDAEQSAFALYRTTETSGQMIETDFAPRGDQQYHLRIGERFRLVVERDLRLFNVFALQNTNSQWGPVPFSLDAKSGQVHLPGFHPDGSYAYMQELRDTGPSLFAVVACRQELPEVLRAHAAEGTTLDVSSLVSLADALRSSKPTDRRLFSVSVLFGRE